MKSQLPEIYRSILVKEKLEAYSSPSGFGIDCTLCQGRGGDSYAAKGSRVGEPDRQLGQGKCCYYHPFIPNYLVGSIRKLGGGQAARVIGQKVQRGEWCLPIGICPPPPLVIEYQELGGDNLSARGKRLCPFYTKASGQCSIWDFRDAVCAAYFCGYEPFRQVEWREWEARLFNLQIELATEALFELGWLPHEFAYLWPAAHGDARSGLGTEEALAPEILREVWREYRGRELDFYELCYERVRMRPE